MSVPKATLLACITLLRTTFPVPSKLTALATTSPVILKFLAVSNAVAVSALPSTSPTTLPVYTASVPSVPLSNILVPSVARTSPVKSPCQAAVTTLLIASTSKVLLSPNTLPCTSPK